MKTSAPSTSSTCARPTLLYLQNPKQHNRRSIGAPRGPRRWPSQCASAEVAQLEANKVTRPQTVLGTEKAARNKVAQGQATTSTQCLDRAPRPLGEKEEGGPQSKQATRLTGGAISLTGTWFSVTPLQASQALVAWVLLHPRVAVEIFARRDPVLGVFSTCLDPQVPKCLLGSDTWLECKIRALPPSITRPSGVAKDDVQTTKLWSRSLLEQFWLSAAAADRHISINPRKAEKKSPRYGLEG